jgi:hypothetical protein
MEGLRPIQVEERVVATGQDGRHIVAEVLPRRVTDDSDGSVTPFLEELLFLFNLVEK